MMLQTHINKEINTLSHETYNIKAYLIEKGLLNDSVMHNGDIDA